MKPFDLEKALAGEPVRLKNGLKAFVLNKVENKELANLLQINTNSLVGYASDNSLHLLEWNEQGDDLVYCNQEYSITGMWEEPRRFINGIEVPEPVTLDNWVNGISYWFVNFSYRGEICLDYLDADYHNDKNLIEKGLVFETKEGAEAMAKALLNYKIETK
ncbi:hypothetical protein L5B97_09580 [Avibacterium sp. 20-15]|uniref:hypothetical protein n=1 Tax=unclassified Avibacterium TaxID=2685287 RepID=UPI002025D827|nr:MULTISPECIES: hypothetical protein [unclassified Avibacterium]MCW9733705.1 hypothetical protein [Avibacterium sp. 20-15]URL03555.1 hypothetical protein L4F93_08270 [Avibacterium sp. 20-132]